MKRLPWITALLLMSASTAALAAPDSCERVKSDIQQKIVNNGVPESGYAEHRAKRSGRSAGCAGGWALCQRHL